MNEARRQARWRKRRIIYNNDGDDAIYARSGLAHDHDVAESLAVRTEGELIDDFLDARSTPLIGSQVDSNWYASCMAGLYFSHHTKLGGFYDKEMPLELVEQYERDTLQIQTDFSHEHGMEAFWSLRMNDGHDSYPAGARRWDYGLAPFKRDHPEYLFGPKSLNYEFPEVRDYIYRILASFCTRFDLDGIELDWWRGPRAFPASWQGKPLTAAHLKMMNDLMRHIRIMTERVGEQRGRPLLVSVRTPMSVKTSLKLGFDLRTTVPTASVATAISGTLYVAFRGARKPRL